MYIKPVHIKLFWNFYFSWLYLCSLLIDKPMSQKTFSPMSLLLPNVNCTCILALACGTQRSCGPSGNKPRLHLVGKKLAIPLSAGPASCQEQGDGGTIHYLQNRNYEHQPQTNKQNYTFAVSIAIRIGMPKYLQIFTLREEMN